MKELRFWMGCVCCAALLAGCSEGQSTVTNNQGGPQTFPNDDGHFCGDGWCDDDEDEKNCNKDCKQFAATVCGDGTCVSGETQMNCPQDCTAVCGDGRCEGDEDEGSAFAGTFDDGDEED